ncbi:hypothetical protein NA56DRAFT_58649 [Hyaloscypha hepaticicola]|uniref:Uncharacterized protein n=1 Tax=Hyaloscypha hepaticicola TaxID=2082293 RepID=A0A2J6PDD0_9HELO|nr:hypothetical protein NA56DRAFT_58649 [Hyaloscypha hepaticicola]
MPYNPLISRWYWALIGASYLDAACSGDRICNGQKAPKYDPAAIVKSVGRIYSRRGLTCLFVCLSIQFLLHHDVVNVR